jgi:hypothetical protein
LEPTERLIHETRMALEKNSRDSVALTTETLSAYNNDNNININTTINTNNATTSTESTIQTILDVNMKYYYY